MKLILSLVMVLVVAVSLTAVEISGEFTTRMMSYYFDWISIEDNVDNLSIYDSSIELEFKAHVLCINNASFDVVFRLKAGEFIWGDNENPRNIDAKHLYLQFDDCDCSDPTPLARLGFQPWADRKSLVFDDDVGALFMRVKGSKVAFELGVAVLESALISRNVEENLRHYILGRIGLEYSEMIGIQIFGLEDATKSNMFKRDMYNWFMPYFNHSFGGFTLDAMYAFGYGKMRRGPEDNYQSHAIAVDLEYETSRSGTFGLNLLNAFGSSDKSDSKGFLSITPNYKTGLEILGNGVLENIPRDFDLNPYNDGLGLMSLVGRYSYPLHERVTARLAVGTVMANHSRELFNDEGESLGKTSKEMGTEINLGLDVKRNNISMSLVGAYAITGNYFNDILEEGRAKRKDAWGYGLVFNFGF
jgi:hypothetical protein